MTKVSFLDFILLVVAPALIFCTVFTLGMRLLDTRDEDTQHAIEKEKVICSSPLR